MSISGTDLTLIRSTRAAFTVDAERTGRAFYDALFRREPDLRPLFSDDLSDQSRKLVSTICVIIDAGRDWDRLTPVLESLARRHLAYRVRADHYATVGLALTDALAETGASQEVLDAWARVYDAVSCHMIRQAYPDR